MERYSKGEGVIRRAANNLNSGKAKLMNLVSVDRIYRLEYYYVKAGCGRS